MHAQHYAPQKITLLTPTFFTGIWYWGLALKILIRNQFRVIGQIHRT